jgi:hypothetical protein
VVTLLLLGEKRRAARVRAGLARRDPEDRLAGGDRERADARVRVARRALRACDEKPMQSPRRRVRAATTGRLPYPRRRARPPLELGHRGGSLSDSRRSRQECTHWPHTHKGDSNAAQQPLLPDKSTIVLSTLIAVDRGRNLDQKTNHVEL